MHTPLCPSSSPWGSHLPILPKEKEPRMEPVPHLVQNFAHASPTGKLSLLALNSHNLVTS